MTSVDGDSRRASESSSSAKRKGRGQPRRASIQRPPLDVDLHLPQVLDASRRAGVPRTVVQLGAVVGTVATSKLARARGAAGARRR